MNEPEESEDINILFSRNPVDLTDTDIDSIIEHMRKKRHLFKSNPAAVAAKSKQLTDKQKAVSSLKLDLDL